MNLKRRKAGFVLAVMMALTMTASIASGQDRDKGWFNDHDRDKTLVGAWRTVVTIVNCQTKAPMATFKGQFTFNVGGTMAEYGIGPGQTPALRSPGNGDWEREHGWQVYSFAFTFNRYDASGAMIGSQRVKATAHLAASGDEFTTDSAIQILDANDNVVMTACGTTVATRFE